MDVPKEEKLSFLTITSIISLSESEITQPGTLSMHVIEKVWKKIDQLDVFLSPKVVESILSNV